MGEALILLGPDNQPMALAELPHILTLLRESTDSALYRASLTGIADAVNWGDLSCVRAEHFESSEGHAGWRVWIEEAAPEATELQTFVRGDLALHGWPGVEVVTEW